jgi:hypothetical protein
MYELIREEHSFGLAPSTKDLCHHLYTRMSCGKVVIVTNNPNTLMSPLRKYWLKLVYKVKRERSSTMNSTLIFELTKTITRMHNLSFAARWPQDEYLADVYIATVEQLIQWSPEASCKTLYVTCEVTNEQLYMVTAWMSKGSLVVTL